MRTTGNQPNKLVAGISLTLMAFCIALGFKSEAASPPEASQDTAASNAPTQEQTKTLQEKPAIDRTGKRRVGKASFYADRFAGRKMADGNRMNMKGANAASRTLPLGTTAKVTNLKTGKSAVVVIQDRGPYVDGRIVDLSQGTAEKIGLTRREGITRVAISPITVPLPDRRIKLGAAVSEEPEYARNENERDKSERSGGGS